ncbi:MAG: FAD-binding oxidoreductase [Pseudomonadota bacterium]
MKKEIFKEFDGYERILEERDYSRKVGLDYSAHKDLADPYIQRLHPKQLVLRVSEIINETPSAKTLRLVSPERVLPPFLAGQYIALFLEIKGIRTSRPYSISSPPNQAGYYDLTVRRVEEGLVSNFLLDEVQRGDLLQSSGPEGHFYYNPLFHDKTMVCLAGGSGITPFMSIIREVLECGLDREIVLFYGNPDLREAIFHHLLLDLSERFSNIHYIPVIESPPEGYQGRVGLISAELIKNTLDQLEGKTFYLCGPQAMYDFCIPELERLGIPRRKIRQEVYGPPIDITRAPNWPKEVKADNRIRVKINDGRSLEARSGQTLAVALERQGVRVPTLCRSGECSQCRVKVISGRVFQPAGALVRKSDRRFGYIHACVSYPLEDLEIMI